MICKVSTYLNDQPATKVDAANFFLSIRKTVLQSNDSRDDGQASDKGEEKT